VEREGMRGEREKWKERKKEGLKFIGDLPTLNLR
jgi:hypothetical protein